MPSCRLSSCWRKSLLIPSLCSGPARPRPTGPVLGSFARCMSTAAPTTILGALSLHAPTWETSPNDLYHPLGLEKALGPRISRHCSPRLLLQSSLSLARRIDVQQTTYRQKVRETARWLSRRAPATGQGHRLWPVVTASVKATLIGVCSDGREHDVLIFGDITRINTVSGNWTYPKEYISDIRLKNFYGLCHHSVQFSEWASDDDNDDGDDGDDGDDDDDRINPSDINSYILLYNYIRMSSDTLFVPKSHFWRDRNVGRV